MKLPKTLLQTIAVAVTVTTVNTACGVDDDVKPEKDKKNPEQQQPYNCPACGLG
ncbi:hypothetical protein ACO2Q8_00375 [Larkinella sp. VNQ87]|uniref:chryseobasin-related MNIO class RiPP peptide n=1 Tax=Larkinella sp. VNQ87 TaxID=3400921 RepID=UPI003C0629E1